MFAVNTDKIYVEGIIGLSVNFRPDVDYATLNAMLHGSNLEIACGTLKEMKTLKNKIRDAMLAYKFDTGYFDVALDTWIAKK